MYPDLICVRLAEKAARGGAESILFLSVCYNQQY